MRCPTMDEAANLRALAAKCRRLAATLHAERAAATLREMAREFDASAAASERLPLLHAYPRRVRG